MLYRFLQHFRKFDWVVFGSVLLLTVFGLTIIYSVGLGGGEAAMLNFKKQVIFAAVGIILLLAVSAFNFHAFYGLSWWVYGGAVGLLVLVLMIGQTVRGTQGWFDIAGFSLQPSELVKVAMVVVLAKYLSAASYKSYQLRHLAVTGLVTAVPAGLIMLQPDFGSAMIIVAFWLGLLALFGLNRRQIVAAMLTGLILFTFSFFFLLKGYQKERIISFLNPAAGTLDQRYNVDQAIIAIGAGGLAGRGLGFGSQSQLKFLPESQNDFIFAVIGEELGLVGITLVLAFFAVLFFRLVYWAYKLDNNFGLYIVLGSIILLFIEMFINIGMNIGMLPVVGISLPFVSYGGSSMIASMLLIGIAESVIVHARHSR